MTLYLIRHGQSGENDGSTISSDSPLTERGREQARRTGARLASGGIDSLGHTPPAVVYTSPARRAVETAREIATACSASLNVEPKLCEYGMLYDDPGLTASELKDIAPDAILPAGFPVHHGWAEEYRGETKEEMVSRADGVIDLLTTTHPVGTATIAVVSHAHFGGFLMGRLFGIPREGLSRNRIRLFNCGITKVGFSGTYKIMFYSNQTSHLNGVTTP